MLDHRQGLAGPALLRRLTDTDDRPQPARQGGLGLGTDQGIAFTMIAAPLGMPDNDIACPRIGKHRRGDIARVGTRCLGVTVLRAHLDGALPDHVGDGGQQGGRRTERNPDIGLRREPIENAAHQRIRRLPQAIHFPVTDDQFAHGALSLP